MSEHTLIIEQTVVEDKPVKVEIKKPKTAWQHFLKQMAAFWRFCLYFSLGFGLHWAYTLINQLLGGC